MSYKTEFISKLDQVFGKELAEKRARESTSKLIEDFFTDLKFQTEEISEVAKTNFSVTLGNNDYKVKMDNCSLRILYSSEKVTIESLVHGSGRSYIFPFNYSECGYVREGKERFDEETLDSYLGHVFRTHVENSLR
jgi:hypothetical protein